MATRRWGTWLDIGVTAVAFLAAVGLAWAVCAWAGHPQEGANRWAVCIGFATVVATASGFAVHRGIAGRDAGATTVLGDRNRVAGTGAHHNDFGDRLPPARPVPPSPGTAGQPPVPETGGGDVHVRGNSNRVAGPNASHNTFGDGVAAPDEGTGPVGPGAV
ncbi:MULTISPECIES: hypothetical protein [unclassified Streptomyces]|uniref:hypothetical protein n=1 Tax=unclassified Streptomyces TaxID=2593676 RepID=UPI0004BFFF41|nr:MULTISPECIES: hypothetical protein [unclassified Streptomyces]